MEKLDLHGITVEEGLEKARKNIDWCIKNGVQVLDIIHGKGLHSDRTFSVMKKDLRMMLKDYPPLTEAGYRVIYGESELPVALTFDEGHTLMVLRGLEKEYIGGKKEQEKNKRVFSDEGKKERKAQKRKNHSR